jgi:hypothetical protein
MAVKPNRPTRKKTARKPRARRWIGALFAPLLLASLAGAALIYLPDTPLPQSWNPTVPLDPTLRPTLLTGWKLRRTAADPVLCYAALQKAQVKFTRAPDITESARCHVRNRAIVSALNHSAMIPVGTRCGTALRLAMWEIHALRPLAQKHFNSSITRIRHNGSYSCRTIAGSPRMSQHATANAIDISGFDFADGTQLTLTKDWTGSKSDATFLHDARNSACSWFSTVLSPDFNAAHFDHFHFDQGGWVTCK